MPESHFKIDTLAELERALAKLPEVIEEVFERRLLEQILGESDEVSTAQLRTLRFLAGLSGATTGFPVGQIASGLRISYPAATKAVDRLTERLLAERLRDNGDARTIRVRLTSKGKALVERLVHNRRLALARVLEKLGGEQPARALLSLLESFMSECVTESALNSDAEVRSYVDSDTVVRTYSDNEMRTNPDTV